MKKHLIIGLFCLAGMVACSSGLPVKSVPITTAKIWHAEDRVLFIDAREPEEYAESHIPGAINLPLRQINHLTQEELKRLHKAEHIVAYCLKDFRGYEVAKALAKRLNKATYIMQPYGLNGWKAAGLPLTIETKGVQNL